MLISKLVIEMRRYVNYCVNVMIKKFVENAVNNDFIIWRWADDAGRTYY